MNQNFLDHIQSQAIMAERSDDEKFRKEKYFELMQTLCKAWRRDNPEVPLEMVREEGIKKVGWEYHAYLGADNFNVLKIMSKFGSIDYNGALLMVFEPVDTTYEGRFTRT